MFKPIQIHLSVGSIQNARDELEGIKSTLNEKIEQYLKALAEEGIRVIQYNAARATGADNKQLSTSYIISREGSRTVMTLTTMGEDLLFIEFGAGIRFNNGNTHPFAKDYGYGVGTYPGQTHAYDPNGWYYRVGGNLHHSYGTEATMPVYKAYMTMQEKATEIAQRIFNE